MDSTVMPMLPLYSHATEFAIHSATFKTTSGHSITVLPEVGCGGHAG